MNDLHFVMCCLLSLVLTASVSARQGAADSSPFPREVAGWRAEGVVQTYDRQSVYDYMDGGAEVYLEYGMTQLVVQRYAKKGESPIVFDLFFMDSPAGAFGAFTFEREDEEASVGQGSEYGGGLLRFWQGSCFGFVQAEVETPASKAAVLALGRAVAGRLGLKGSEPILPKVLPQEGLRLRSARFVLSPLLLQVRESSMDGNPLELPSRCEAVVARYGEKGSAERVIVARFPDEPSARQGVAAFLKSRLPEGARPGTPIGQSGVWTCASASGAFAVVVLGASDEAAARARLGEVERKLGEVKP
jgi:hypothetical protein